MANIKFNNSEYYDGTAENKFGVVNTALSENPLTQATEPTVGNKPFLYRGLTPTNVGDGVELITNGTFDTGDSTGWTLTAATISVIDGAAHINDIAPYISIVGQTIPTVIGNDYVISINILGGVWTNWMFYIDGVSTFEPLGTTVATKTIYFTATGTTTNIEIRSGSTVDRGSLICDNISVQESTPATALRPDGTGFYESGTGAWTLGLGSMQVKNSHRIGSGEAEGTTKDTHNVFGDASCLATYNLDIDTNDLSTNFNAVSTGVTYVPGKFGNKADFTTITPEMTIPRTVLTGSTQASISFTVSLTDLTTDLFVLSSAASSPNYYVGLRFSSSTNTLFGGAGQGGAFGLNTSGYVIEQDVDYFVTLTWDNAGDFSFYVNSQLVDKVAVSGMTLASINTDIKAFWNASTTQIGNGYIDQIRFFNKILTQDEISKLHSEVSILGSEDWNDITTYTIGEQAIDHSATGDALTYENITGVNTSTSPRLDTTNWKLADDQFGGKFTFKSRSAVGSHYLFDSVRREQKYLTIDNNANEVTGTTALSGINSNSLTIGTHLGMNTTSVDYVVWVEQTTRKTPGYRTDAGVLQNSKNNIGTDLLETNANGEIYIVHYNPITGLSITIDVGSGNSKRVAHKLGKKPWSIQRKGLSGTTYSHHMYNEYNGPSYYQYLDTGLAITVGTTVWNEQFPTDTEFIVGGSAGVNVNNVQYISYCQANTDYSTLKHYTGKGVVNTFIDSDGLDMTVPGARVVIKILTGTTGWVIHDNLRLDGEAMKRLLFDTSVAENTDDASLYPVIAKQNGIIINTTHATWNAVNEEYRIEMYSPVYNKPTGGKELSFNTPVSVISADGKNINNALQTVQKTFSTLDSVLVDAQSNSTYYAYLNSVTGDVSISLDKMNSGKSRVDADKWGVENGNYRTTAPHYKSSVYNVSDNRTGTVSAMSSLNSDTYSIENAFDKDITTLASAGGWLSASGDLTGYVKYELTEPRALANLRMMITSNTATALTAQQELPHRFTIYGSNDDLVTKTVINDEYSLATGVDYDPVALGVIQNEWMPLVNSNSTEKFKTIYIDLEENGGNVTYIGFEQMELNFEISDGHYLNTVDNKVYDSTETKVDIVPLGEFKVDGSGYPYDILNYKSNAVNFNNLVVEEDIEIKGELNSDQAVVAWVTFDGTQTPPIIHDSKHVSDVIRTATGSFTIVLDVDLESGYSAVTGGNAYGYGGQFIRPLSPNMIQIRSSSVSAYVNSTYQTVQVTGKIRK